MKGLIFTFSCLLLILLVLPVSITDMARAQSIYVDPDRDDDRPPLTFYNIPKEKIPDTESLKDTYERVISFYKQEIRDKLNKNNVLISAHGNSIRALCKEILQISDIKINELEIPTGNPLLINFDNKMVIDQIKYLDKERAKKIIFNT